MWLTLLASARAASFAIVHATVLPVSGPPIADGTVVVVDGRIAAVGAALPAPAGAEIVVCVSVNDPFVMAAWGKQKEAEGKVLACSHPSGHTHRHIYIRTCCYTYSYSYTHTY